MSSIRVVLVHRKELVREGLSRILAEQPGIETAGLCEGGAEGLRMIRQVDPDVIIAHTDVADFDLTLEAGQYFAERLPNTRIILLTDSTEERALFLALRLGARAYLSDDISIEKLIDAIWRIYEGEVIISAPLARKLLQEFSGKDDVRFEPQLKDHDTELTKREVEVLHLVAEGRTNREIADTLFITENTAKVHMRNIMDKLHVRNRQQAVRLATRKGIVSFKSPKDTDPETEPDNSE
ncbi:MAG: response regulator transcription factor [Dehalococcoidia bacterium]